MSERNKERENEQARNRWARSSPEQREAHRKRVAKWRANNPERARELARKASRAYYERTHNHRDRDAKLRWIAGDDDEIERLSRNEEDEHGA